MFVTLMRENNPVCQIRLSCLSLAGIIIQGFKVLNPNEMRALWVKEAGKGQADMIMQSEEIARVALCAWMQQRVIPNTDPDLDKKMLHVYGLDQVHYGRMYEYQYIGAFLSYMTSANDSYWVNPCYTQCLSYVLVDPYFKNLYFVHPTGYQTAKTAGGRFRTCLKDP